jgi:hypothetical protein
MNVLRDPDTNLCHSAALASLFDRETSLKTMRNAVLWDVTSYDVNVYLGFGGTFCLHLHGRKNSVALVR